MMLTLEENETFVVKENEIRFILNREARSISVKPWPSKNLNMQSAKAAARQDDIIKILDINQEEYLKSSLGKPISDELGQTLCNYTEEHIRNLKDKLSFDDWEVNYCLV